MPITNLAAGHRRIVLLLTAVGLAAASAVYGPGAQAAPETEPAQFISALAQEAITVAKGHGDEPERREAAIRKMIDDHFATTSITRFVIGRYWRQMSAAERREIEALFKDWVAKFLVSQVRGYSGETLEVLATEALGARDVMVRSRFRGPRVARPLSVDWRIREFEAGPRIIDVVIEGVSLAAMQRSDFASVLDRRGVDGLFRTLRSRIAELEAPG